MLFVFAALLEYAAVNFLNRQENGFLELLQKKRISRRKKQRKMYSHMAYGKVLLHLTKLIASKYQLVI